MRTEQQNTGMRGRGNNNNPTGTGKAPDPLSRHYESNGPDVKIRGSAQHVAETYRTLARDAQASGDRVAAENYRQHADHYRRIIMAAMMWQNNQRRREESVESDRSDGGGGGFPPLVAVHPYGNGAGSKPLAEGKPEAAGCGEQSRAARSDCGSQPLDGGDQRRSARARRRRRGRVRDVEKSEQPGVEVAVVATASGQSACAEENVRRAEAKTSATEASLLLLAGRVLSNS